MEDKEGLPEVELIDRNYGKKCVRLLHVRKDGHVHYIKDIQVNTALTLDSIKDYTDADNSDVIATDSQKNTVYVLAKINGIESIETFAKELCQHFLSKYSQVTHAKVYIEEYNWRRVLQDQTPHVHAFISSPEHKRYCEVQQSRDSDRFTITSGLDGLKLLKTTRSTFFDFVKDEYTSLPDAEDRIFSTVMKAKWTYSCTKGLDLNKSWALVKSSILEMFAGPPYTGIYSASVQQTLYDAARLCLKNVPQIQKISIEMPNVHHFAFDYSKLDKLGIKENQEVFTPLDKPSGNIFATIERRIPSKL